jgi:hypothetical protein
MPGIGATSSEPEQAESTLIVEVGKYSLPPGLSLEKEREAISIIEEWSENDGSDYSA